MAFPSLEHVISLFNNLQQKLQNWNEIIFFCPKRVLIIVFIFSPRSEYSEHKQNIHIKPILHTKDKASNELNTKKTAYFKICVKSKE